MGSIFSAMKELEEDLKKAQDSNLKYGLTKNQKVTVSGDVYFAGKNWVVRNKSAIIKDLGYPTIALLLFEDGTEGFVSKDRLVK